jgi:hypothetical protein
VACSFTRGPFPEPDVQEEKFDGQKVSKHVLPIQNHVHKKSRVNAIRAWFREHVFSWGEFAGVIPKLTAPWRHTVEAMERECC